MIGPEIDNPRARVSKRILSGKEKFTFEEWTRAATDTRVLEAEAQIPALAAEWERLEGTRKEALAPLIAELKAWDTVSRLDSVAMTLFADWFDRWRQRPVSSEAEQPFGTRVRMLEEVREDLERGWGTWRVAWGEVNRLQRTPWTGAEPFSDERPSLAVPGGPGWLGIVFNFYNRRVPASKRRYGVTGNSYVSVVEFAPRVQARSIVYFGQSGDPKSPHYFDQAELLASGHFKRELFYWEDVLEGAVNAYHPGAGPLSIARKNGQDNK